MAYTFGWKVARIDYDVNDDPIRVHWIVTVTDGVVPFEIAGCTDVSELGPVKKGQVKRVVMNDIIAQSLVNSMGTPSEQNDFLTSLTAKVARIRAKRG